MDGCSHYRCLPTVYYPLASLQWLSSEEGRRMLSPDYMLLFFSWLARFLCHTGLFQRRKKALRLACVILTGNELADSTGVVA